MLFDICPNIIPYRDIGFASEDRKAQGEKYSISRVVNAECGVDKCHRRGRCIVAMTNWYTPLLKRMNLKEV